MLFGKSSISKLFNLICSEMIISLDSIFFDGKFIFTKLGKLREVEKSD